MLVLWYKRNSLKEEVYIDEAKYLEIAVKKEQQTIRIFYGNTALMEPRATGVFHLIRSNLL
jgi:hypothetical protein